MERSTGHPLFGYLPAFRRDRKQALQDLGRKHDAVRIRMGVIPMTIIGSPALAHEILTVKQDAFVKAPGLAIFLRPVLGNGLLTSERDVHTKQRKLLAPAFVQKRITAYASTMAERADRLVSRLHDGERIDITDAMMRLTFEIVGKTLFDTEVDADASEVGEALTVAMECAMGQLESLVPVPPVVPTPTNLRYRRAVARLDKVIFRIIRERRAQGDDRGDVLSMLLAARDEDGGAMTDAEVRDQAMTLFLAGHETTANAMAWTFHLLAKNPDVRERLEAELDTLGRTPAYEDLAKLPYALACMKESMRLYPPAYVLARRAVKDVTLGEQRFRKGSILIISVIGIHHRDSLFPDAERYDPTRFLGDKEKQLPRCAYIPFGAGPRICIGNHFALMEAHVLLATLARGARFDHATNAPVSYEPLVTLRPKELAMRVSLRELRTARVA